MGPSLDPRWGILQSQPTMWLLTLNPGWLMYTDYPGLLLVAMGSGLTVINTRLCIPFFLMALLFMRYRELTGKKPKLVLYCGFVWGMLQFWMMYQAFVLGWVH